MAAIEYPLGTKSRAEAESVQRQRCRFFAASDHEIPGEAE